MRYSVMKKIQPDFNPKKALCNILTPFNLISDALDCSTITNCVTIFDFIEKHTAIWKSSQFYTQGKNNLLRACNDLLRRLSQSQVRSRLEPPNAI